MLSSRGRLDGVDRVLVWVKDMLADTMVMALGIIATGLAMEVAILLANPLLRMVTTTVRRLWSRITRINRRLPDLPIKRLLSNWASVQLYLYEERLRR